jgi:translation elongation factor EF-G
MGIIAHGGAGKTTLAEALLFNAKATERMGRVDDGSSHFDYDPEEIRRQISISTSFHHYNWNKVEVTVADAPGYINFEADAHACLRQLEGAVLVVNAVSGVEVQTERMWQLARDMEVPAIAFVSKMDRERADFRKAVEEISDILKVHAVPVQLPIGSEAGFLGVVDLLAMKAYVYKGETGKFDVTDVPKDLADDAARGREKVVEAAAESDDSLLEKYLEETSLTEEEIRKGFTAGVRAMKILPVLCGSALRNIAIHPVLDMINFVLPYRGSEADLCRRTVFRPGVQDACRPVCGQALHIQDLLRNPDSRRVAPECREKCHRADRPDLPAGGEEAETGPIRLRGRDRGCRQVQGDVHGRYAVRPEESHPLPAAPGGGAGHLVRDPSEDAVR